MALNVSLELEPFERINVCGYRDLRVTRLQDLTGIADVRTVALGLAPASAAGIAFRCGESLQRHQYQFAGGQLAIDGVELFTT